MYVFDIGFWHRRANVSGRIWDLGRGFVSLCRESGHKVLQKLVIFCKVHYSYVWKKERKQNGITLST